MADPAETSSAAAGQPSDEVLIRRCADGDNAAFDVLYGRYRLPLFSYLNRLMPKRADQVEDIFQMTWLRAVRNLPRYTERQRFLPWLCRIAHNLAMDFYRTKGAVVVETMPEQHDERLTPPQAVQRRQMEEALARAICLLPDEQRTVILLRKDGVPFKEIAEREGISLNTALGRMHYAVLKLKKLLAEYI